jgi:hypothetical protein
MQPSSPKKHISKSKRIKKYEVAYELCLKKINIIKMKKSPTPRSKKIVKERYSIRNSRSSIHDTDIKKHNEKRKPSLNRYQKYIQDESKRNKYKNKSPKSRLSLIASSWKKLKSIT